MDEPLDERFRDWAGHLERLRWSAMITDEDWRLVWVSTQLRDFIGAGEDTDLGYGLHIVESLTRPHWMNSVHPQSQAEMFTDLAPFFLHDYKQRGKAIEEILPEEFVPLLEQIELTEEPPQLYSSSFMFVDPDSEAGLSSYRVNMCAIRMHNETGAMLGWLIIFFMGVRPNLLALLAKGDEAMYERMARLVDPGAHQSAILFCDLHASGRLSRELSSPAYFKLVRSLWTCIDEVIARNQGIIGKHAGDGASAFFLTDDLGSSSGAAHACLRAAREIHDVSHDIFDSYKGGCQMKVGVHWGANLFMGQLVPGGRLDVTALGDEVNEGARIQECALPHQTLASKQIIEQLSDDDAADLGIDIEKTRFQVVADLEGAPEKAKRDAGSIAVTPFD